MLSWIIGALAAATVGWLALRPILRDAASEWNQPTLPPETLRPPAPDPVLDAADELRSWIDEGTCPDCGALSLAGDERVIAGPRGTLRRVEADCEECDFHRVIELSDALSRPA